MPNKLPNNFFIPDSSYDEILNGGKEKKLKDSEPTFLAPEVPATPKPHLLYDQLDEILKKANVSQEAMDSVHQAIIKELGIVSQDAIPFSSS